MVDPHRIGVKSDPAQREQALRALAARQSGYFTRRQLLDAGLGDHALRHQLQIGRFVAVHFGVYGIAPLRADLVGRAWAAVLACGSDAVASHITAAMLWGLIRLSSHLAIHVTAPVKRTRSGIVTHRGTALASADITHQRGVPVTARARTVLDIAPVTAPRQLRRMVNDQARQGALRLDAIRDVLRRNPRHPGCGILKTIVDEARHGLTRSTLEDDFLAFLRTHDLPIPRLNVIVDGVEVDAYYATEDLVVELDTLDYHADPPAFEADRERDARHLVAGRRTLRITGERLTSRPAQEAARLRRILAAG